MRTVKDADSALVGCEILSRELLEAMPAAVYTTDTSGRITYYNQAAADLWGRRPEIGTSQWCGSWKLYRPDGSPLPHDECPMATALKEQRPVRGIEAVAERPDGTRVPFMPFPTPLHDTAGRFIGAVNMLIDMTERNSAERARQQLAAIVESSDDAIVSKDLAGNIISWNRAAERLFGYTAEEAVGKPITITFPPDRHDEEGEILERLVQGERVEHYETVRRRKDGSLVDVSLRVSPIRDAEGMIVGASKIARDITERKRAERSLAQRVDEQAALYQFTDKLHHAESLTDVFTAALDAMYNALRCERASILLRDESGELRFVAWRGLSDVYRRAVDGHAPWTLDAEDPKPVLVGDVDRSNLSSSLAAIVKAEGIRALAFVPLVAEGRLIGKFMTYYGSVHEFTDAEIQLSVTVARQLAFSIQRMRGEEARRRAEKELRASERRLELALTAGQMGAWEWDIETGQVIWSPGLEKMHGLEPGTFGGRFEDFKREIHLEDLPSVFAQMQRSVETGTEYHTTYRMNGPDGSVRWLEAFGNPVLARDGTLEKLAGVCMDITERRRAEEERDLLVAELSHRVKNTLAIVISIAQQSFANSLSPAEARRSFEARIRALAQTHSRLAEANWSGVSLETILRDELAPYGRDDGSNVSVSGPPTTLNPKCALMLGMAVHELATNAAKHGALSTEEGAVRVDWHVNGCRTLRIDWTETGGPATTSPGSGGFGRLLLERALASDLNGDVHLNFLESGLRCSISIPLDKNVAHAA